MVVMGGNPTAQFDAEAFLNEHQQGEIRFVLQSWRSAAPGLLL
jgi:hypothetical protein